MSDDALRRRPWYREIEFLILTILVAGVTLPRLTVLPLWGNEALWALVARRMIATGNYLVPSHWHQPFFDRPPLLSWTMIGAARLLGDFNLTAVRLPDALAVIATAWLIYAYARQVLSPVGALAAACSFPTMGLLLKYDRGGQTDTLFTLWVSASLLLWHAGYRRSWPASATWALGWGCAALAALTKGIQGPVYFAGAVILVVMRERRWRYVFSVPHGFGILLFLAVVGSWLVPVANTAGMDAALASFIEGGMLNKRVAYGSAPPRQLFDLMVYPAGLMVSMLPWSVVLAAFLDPAVRRRAMAQAHDVVLFLIGACLVGLLTCWPALQARPRHFMPLFPCVALLIGTATDVSWRAAHHTGWERARRALLTLTALLIGLTACVYVGAAMVPAWREPWLAPTPARALLYAAAAILSIVAVSSSRPGTSPGRASAAIVGIAGFVGVTYVGPVLDGYHAMRAPTAEQTAAVRSLMPAGTLLVSFGPTHDAFEYYYDAPLEFRGWPQTAADVDPGVTYFCFWPAGGPRGPGQLPFEWEKIATVECDWTRLAVPEHVMIIGRRIDAR